MSSQRSYDITNTVQIQQIPRCPAMEFRLNVLVDPYPWVSQFYRMLIEKNTCYWTLKDCPGILPIPPSLYKSWYLNVENKH